MGMYWGRTGGVAEEPAVLAVVQREDEPLEEQCDGRGQVHAAQRVRRWQTEERHGRRQHEHADVHQQVQQRRVAIVHQQPAQPSALFGFISAAPV